MGLTKTQNLILLFITICLVKGQEDSLRTALRAVDRRQRDLSQYSRYGGRYAGTYERPDEVAFLGNSDYSDAGFDHPGEISSLDYLEYEPYSDAKVAKKSIQSPFRERVEQDKERQLEELARIYLEKLNSDDYENDEYNELIKQIWEKYKNRQSPNRNSIFSENDVKKRQYYPAFGLDSIGLRKRSRYFEPDGPRDSLHLLSYAPRDEIFDRLQENNDLDNPNYLNVNDKYMRRERKYDHRTYPYSTSKRFPVAKRSNPYTPKEVEEQEQQETKNDLPSKTDPKVAKDLSNIFGTSGTEKPTAKNQQNNSTKKLDSSNDKQKLKNSAKSSSRAATTKEIVYDVHVDKPLQIKKKSIDWSDYFGLDRRKKSESDIDGDWLLERYHKATNADSKRDAKYQLKSFKNHDEPVNPKQFTSNTSKEKEKKTSYTPDEMKINDMDAKLRQMEDSIIDDAIKYTGAHEGITDSKEIQEVKDKVISRLAAAYSLEKMRRALGEYKLSIAKEKERLLQEQRNEDFHSMKEKRLSVPRKQAIDDERENIEKADNNIKCTQADEDCEEQNYKTPSDILELNNYDTENCPKVETACSEVSSILGHYARIFQTACNMHQMCLLCGNNSWFAPTRQCNVLFLSKTYELCSGNPECQREAQRSVRYLLDVNRSLRAEPMENCELSCPENR